MRTSLRSFLSAATAFLLAVQPLLAQFKQALPGYRYEFPRDYFDHPDYRTEWWYYTGNLQSADGRKFGFELTFFRHGVTRSAAPASGWEIQDLYVAHFAVSDLDGKKFFHLERSNRSGPSIAGADIRQQRVWNGNWSASWKEGSENLSARGENSGLELSLRPQKPPVIHGENGVSQKSAGRGRASHYFSETRLLATGSLAIDSRSFAVSGQAWMDHEFFTEQLAPDQAGWDWLSIQMDDNSELMLFHLRRKDGTIDPFSAGTFIDAQGRPRHLRNSDFQLAPSGQFWKSPDSAANYPIAWRIGIPSLDIAAEATTLLPSQELATKSRLMPTYWEGAIDIKGNKGAAPIRGSGYLEMTGYDHPVEMK